MEVDDVFRAESDGISWENVKKEGFECRRTQISVLQELILL